MSNEPHEQAAIEYAADKFRRLGVVAQEAGIATVLDYINEYYEEVYEGDDDIGVVFFSPEDVANYISETRPDIPDTVIHTILDARQEFIDSLTVTEYED